MQFSVLMSIYKNENPEHFRLAMESILKQSVRPNEIVLVRDGEVPTELQEVIDEYIRRVPIIRYCPLTENVGLGNALNVGLLNATCEFVARMDTDDICTSDRFEKQVRFLEENPSVDMLGGQIEEFIGEESNIVSKREVPLTDAEIKAYIKKRNPFNHQTVMFKKAAVMAVGNYQELHFLEDYYLWCRLCANGCTFANLPEVLVRMRVSEDMYRRRGGFRYFQSFKKLEKYKKKAKMIGFCQYVKALIIRFTITMMPNGLRGWAYKRFARKKVKE